MTSESPEILFPTLARSVLDELMEFGSERQLAASEVLYRAGEARWDFNIVLEGQVEIERPPAAFLGVAAGVGEFSRSLGALGVLGTNIGMMLVGGSAALSVQRRVSAREAPG